MAPRKRALAEADPNSQTDNTNGRNKKGKLAGQKNDASASKPESISKLNSKSRADDTNGKNKEKAKPAEEIDNASEGNSKTDTSAKNKKGKAGGKNKKKDTVSESEKDGDANDSTPKQKNATPEKNPLHNLHKKEPYEYIIMTRPLFDFQIESDRIASCSNVIGYDSEDWAFEHFKEAHKNCLTGELSSNHPEHKWIMLRAAYMRYCDLKRLASYTDPDSFGMYIYNDFHSHGLMEVIDNQEWSKKNKNITNLKSMWAILTALLWWLHDSANDIWMHADDPVRTDQITESIGIAFLTCLDEFDKANLLKSKSEIADVELVISMILRYFYDKPEYGIEKVKWLKYVNGYYSGNAELDISKNGCASTPDFWASVQEYGIDKKKAKSADVFGWKKTWAKHKKSTIIGTTPSKRYNILEMTRLERASFAFDKTDPLAEFSLKDLRGGNIMLGY